MADTIGEWVSKQGLRQLRIAETEKYAHVTFSSTEAARISSRARSVSVVASPKVATY
ncbi:protein containing BPG-independent PGAM, partial [human gut metagenome]